MVSTPFVEDYAFFIELLLYTWKNQLAILVSVYFWTLFCPPDIFPFINNNSNNNILIIEQIYITVFGTTQSVYINSFNSHNSSISPLWRWGNRETEDPKCGHPALHGAARVATVDQAWGPERSSHLGETYSLKKRGAGWSEISCKCSYHNNCFFLNNTSGEFIF